MAINHTKFNQTPPPNLAICDNERCPNPLANPASHTYRSDKKFEEITEWGCGSCGKKLKLYTDEGMAEITGANKRKRYRELIEPVIEQVVELYIASEVKKCEGLNLNDPINDGMKSIKHMVLALDGQENPDGFDHNIASIARGIKRHLGINHEE